MNFDLQVAHDRLAGLIGETAEPIEVLQRVEEHRQYWRPDKVRVLLLAESHVYTAASELARGLRRTLELPAGLPTGFVRLVYSLGYGENELLDERVGNNVGSPQFWKIFKSCVTRVGEVVDCSSLQRSPNTGAVLRLRSKLAVLEALRVRGVWLVDASVVALYRPGQAPLTFKTEGRGTSNELGYLDESGGPGRAAGGRLGDWDWGRAYLKGTARWDGSPVGGCAPAAGAFVAGGSCGDSCHIFGGVRGPEADSAGAGGVRNSEYPQYPLRDTKVER
jgi:hypothetical protein